MTRHGSVRLAWSLACATLIALAIMFVGRTGALLTPDSLSYVGAAHSLAEQGTLRAPFAKWNDSDSTTVLQQFPPGYSATLGAALYAGVTSGTVVQVVNAFSSFTLVALLVWLCSAAADDAWTVRVAAPLAILAVRAIPTAWASAWSEPLFLVALAATLFIMAARPRSTWILGISAALGNAIRYAGVSLLLAAALWAGWQAYLESATPASVPVPRTQRIARAARAAFITALPGILFNVWWLWRARHFGVTTPVATVAWMGNLPAARDEAIATIAAQLVPLANAFPSWVRMDIALILLMGVVAAILAALRSARRDSAKGTTGYTLATNTILASLTIAICYAAMLVYSRLFVGSSIPFDDRLLAPLVLSVGVAALLALHSRIATASSRVRAFAVAACMGWLVAAASQSYLDVASLLEDRDDYGSEYWTGTEAADWMRANGKQYALYSNDPVATYFITGRPSRMVPSRMGKATAPDFLLQLRATNGVLIEYPKPLEDMVDARELARQVGLCNVVTSEVGIVWRLPTSALEHCDVAADSAKSEAAPSPSAPTLPAPDRKSR